MNTPYEHPQLDALLAESGWLHALARRLVQDPADAEDIAQSTLALALEKRPDVDGGLRPWLAKVVHRLARRRVRSDGRRQAREAVVSSIRDSSSSASDEVLMRFEIQRDLAKRVDGLPDPYRRVLILRYFKGLSVTEIAAARNTPLSTIRSQLARGIDRLRLYYNQDDDRRRSLAILVGAIAPSQKFTLNKIAEVTLLKMSTKVAVVAFMVIVAAVILVFENENEDDGVLGDNDVAIASEENTMSVRRSDNTSTTQNDEGSVRSEKPQPLPGQEEINPPINTELAKRQVSVIRARILGEDSMPLVGAKLSSIYPDGRPRGTKNVALSDGSGRIVLELSDASMRKWRTQTMDMLFMASADDFATKFVFKQPLLHRETDLGDIRLRFGATLFGTCVDSKGNPIAGAVLYASDSVLTEDLEVLKVTGPRSGGSLPRALSSADGSFVLSGISTDFGIGNVAQTQLWANTQGHFWTTLGPFDIEPSSRFDVGEVVLTEVPAELRVEGFVLQPGGLPAAGARIDFMSTSMPPHGQVFADGEGHFVIVRKDDTPLELIARGSADNFGMSSTTMAKRGELVELHLTERQSISLTVIDQKGKPIRDVHVMPTLNTAATDVDQATRLVPGEKWSYTDENGMVEVAVPNQRFSVEVRNTNYASKTLGPYTAASAPETLTVTMPRGAELTGRVLAYGKPVIGAKVAVMRHHVDFAAMTGGFPNRYPSGTHTYTTDAEGRFRAPLKKNWYHVGVVASLEGLATGEFTVQIEPGEDVQDVDVQMTEGGKIEGVVTPPTGVAVNRLYVAASRGDGQPISTFVDAKGRFRLQGLTPGNWRVEGRTREVRKEMLSISRRPEDIDPRWNAVVVDRKTLKLNIDMSHLGDVEVHGEIKVDGAAPLRGWTVQVVRPRHERGPTNEKAVKIDQHGEFTFMARPGRAQFRLLGPLKNGIRTELRREVHLKGPRFTWQESLQTGLVREVIKGRSLQVRLVRGTAEDSSQDLTTVFVDEEGRVHGRVPVGQSRLETRPQGSRSDGDWNALRVIDVH